MVFLDGKLCRLLALRSFVRLLRIGVYFLFSEHSRTSDAAKLMGYFLRALCRYCVQFRQLSRRQILDQERRLPCAFCSRHPFSLYHIRVQANPRSAGAVPEKFHPPSAARSRRRNPSRGAFLYRLRRLGNPGAIGRRSKRPCTRTQNKSLRFMVHHHNTLSSDICRHHWRHRRSG